MMCHICQNMSIFIQLISTVSHNSCMHSDNNNYEDAWDEAVSEPSNFTGRQLHGRAFQNMDNRLYQQLVDVDVSL